MTNAVAMKALEQTEEFKAFQKNARAFQATVNADDTISAEEVTPGDSLIWEFMSFHTLARAT